MGHAVQWYLETWAPCHSPWKFTIQVSTCPRQTKPGALLRSEAERWLGDPPPGQDALSQRLLSDVSAQPAQIALSEMPARSRAWHHQNRSAPGRCGHQPVPVFSLANEEACACACAHHCGATKAAGKRKRCDRPARQGLDVEASVANAERSSARGRRGFLHAPLGAVSPHRRQPPISNLLNGRASRSG